MLCGVTMKTRSTTYGENFSLFQIYFGKVCSKRKTSCQNLIKAILYPPRLTNATIECDKKKRDCGTIAIAGRVGNRNK